MKKISDTRALEGAREAWHDFRWRLVQTYGGPSPFLKVEEMEAALWPNERRQPRKKAGRKA
jgi:hypothetical protein